MSKIITLGKYGSDTPTKPIRILVGMLVPSHTMNIVTFGNLQNLISKTAKVLNYDGTGKYEVVQEINICSLVHHGRNRLCQIAINENFDYLLQIDSDMDFDADNLITLLGRNKDFVSGLAFSKVNPIKPVMGVKMEPEKDFSSYQLIENWVDGAMIKVDGVGAAFSLVKVDMLRKMGGPKWYYHAEVGNSQLGEDYTFCAEAQKAGYDIWVDTSVKLGHFALHPYGIEEFIACGGKVKAKKETRDITTEYDSFVQTSYKEATG